MPYDSTVTTALTALDAQIAELQTLTTDSDSIRALAGIRAAVAVAVSEPDPADTDPPPPPPTPQPDPEPEHLWAIKNAMIGLLRGASITTTHTAAKAGATWTY